MRLHLFAPHFGRDVWLIDMKAGCSSLKMEHFLEEMDACCERQPSSTEQDVERALHFLVRSSELVEIDWEGNMSEA